MRMKMHTRKDVPILQDPRPMTKIDFGDHYPDGGWGWVVVGAATLVYTLCHGFHFAFGTMFMVWTYDDKESPDKQSPPSPAKRDDVDMVWLGSIGFGISLFMSPVVTVICRRKSPRVIAVLGGLIIFLGCLFLSFSTNLQHLFFSHFVFLSVGTGLTVTTANIIIGRYFRQKRELAEMIVLSGTGFGAAFISFLVDELCSKFKWVRAMGSIAGLLATSMCAGAMYRSATLYHPRRNVLQHIKNQKKCRREQEKPSYFDFTALRMRSLQALIVIVAIIGFGMHVPVILLIHTAKLHGIADESLMLLNVFLGVGFSVGCYFVGFIVVRDNSDCSISRRNLAQACAVTSGAFTLLFILAKDYQAYALYACAFGVSSGGYYYAVKMYTYELVREKIMERAWGFVAAAQFISVLFGPPLAIYLNESYTSDVACYIFAGVTTLFGGLLFSGMARFEKHFSNHEIIQRYQCACSKNTTEAAALLDLDLTNVMVTKPLNNDQFIFSPSRKHNHGREGSKIQMQCFIQHRDKEKPKQIVLSRITEEKEGLRLDFNEISQPSSSAAKSSSESSRRKSVSEKDLSSLPICENHCGDLPSESTNSNNTSNKGSNSSRSDKKFRRSSENVKVDYFDPPSQEKESTATVSYDSDLYINLCEAQV